MDVRLHKRLVIFVALACAAGCLRSAGVDLVVYVDEDFGEHSFVGLAGISRPGVQAERDTCFLRVLVPTNHPMAFALYTELRNQQRAGIANPFLTHPWRARLATDQPGDTVRADVLALRAILQATNRVEASNSALFKIHDKPLSADVRAVVRPVER